MFDFLFIDVERDPRGIELDALDFAFSAGGLEGNGLIPDLIFGNAFDGEFPRNLVVHFHTNGDEILLDLFGRKGKRDLIRLLALSDQVAFPENSEGFAVFAFNVHGRMDRVRVRVIKGKIGMHRGIQRSQNRFFLEICGQLPHTTHLPLICVFLNHCLVK